MITMYDAVTIANIPPDPEAVAGYVDGYRTWSQLCERFPHAHRLSIAINAEDDADCLDVEAGAATIEQTPAWVKRQIARGVWRPCVYASEANMPAITAALKAAGLARAQVRLWVARWGAPTIPAGYDGCQWHGGVDDGYDESLLLSSFFAGRPKPAKKTARKRTVHPKVAAGTTAGAIGIALTAILKATGVHIDAELGAAISTLGMALAGYATPARSH